MVSLTLLLGLAGFLILVKGWVSWLDESRWREQYDRRGNTRIAGPPPTQTGLKLDTSKGAASELDSQPQ